MNEEEARIEQIRAAEKLDEELTKRINHAPRIWRLLYLDCIEEGFEDKQAFELLKLYITDWT